MRQYLSHITECVLLNSFEEFVPKIKTFGILVTGILGLEIGCSMIVSYEERYRVISPDRKVEAVFVVSNGGATTGYGANLYIVSQGAKIRKGYEILIADNFDLQDIYWIQPKLLEIKYKCGHIFKFRNYWQSKEVDNFEYPVEIRLTCTSE